MKKRSEQEILAIGMRSEFWRILCEGIQKNIDNLKMKQSGKNLSSLPADQYKLENEIILAKIRYLESLMNLPENLIQEIGNTVEENVNLDPFRTPEDF